MGARGRSEGLIEVSRSRDLAAHAAFFR